jgi:hypothetical protein
MAIAAVGEGGGELDLPLGEWTHDFAVAFVPSSVFHFCAKGPQSGSSSYSVSTLLRKPRPAGFSSAARRRE